MNPVKIHPIRSESIILWGDDRNEELTLVKGENCEGSIISFDKRQIWTVYPYKNITVIQDIAVLVSGMEFI